jgi:hypothetical protein
MRFPRVLLAACFAVVGLAVGPGTADAATVPVISGTHEVGVPAGGGRMLLVYGLNLTKVTAWELDEAGGTLIAPLTVVIRGKTLTALALPATLVPPTYVLPGTFSLKYSTRTATSTVLIKLTGGFIDDGAVASSSLATALRTDLDDALTVGGEDGTDFHDASLLTGSLPTSAFSAYDDLVAEAKVGTGASQVAAGNHDHNTVYPLRTELTAVGMINTGANPVDWSQLKGVPAAFADGTDDGGGALYSAGTGLTLTSTTFSVNFAGNGAATTASKSDHNHDSSYYTQAQLNASGGTINTGSNPVDWTRLKGVPAGIADGTDADTTYTNGTGLGLSGTTFSINFGGTGSAATAARSDHTHTGYLLLTGGTMTGTLTINDSTNQALVTTSGTTSSTAGGIDGTTSGGIGVAGHGNIGVLGDLDSDGSFGVMGSCAYAYQVGVYAYANSGSGDSSTKALYAYHYWGGIGVDAKSYSGTALYAHTPAGYATVVRVVGNYGSTGINTYVGSYGTGMYTYSGYRGTGLYVRAGTYGVGVRSSVGYRAVGVYSSTGSYGIAVQARTYNGTGMAIYAGGSSKPTGLLVNGYYTPNLAVFQTYGSNYARIDSAGRGYFNGGTYTGGADFAESVKAGQPVAEFEPGDVVVIDVSAPRQFLISTEADSPLVAGVISTKPALVGSLHNVAKGRNEKMRREEVKLGIVGIVPTKVCDEGGPIAIGDLLVSASLPGHAKKAPAVPAVGTVLGKALGRLDAGAGRIEVLLMAR